MKIKNFITEMLNNTKNKIIECVNLQLENNEKKDTVDNAIKIWVEKNAGKLSPVQRLLISKWFVPTIPAITQIIYDCLKQKVEGLTLNG